MQNQLPYIDFRNKMKSQPQYVASFCESYNIDPLPFILAQATQLILPKTNLSSKKQSLSKILKDLPSKLSFEFGKSTIGLRILDKQIWRNALLRIWVDLTQSEENGTFVENAKLVAKELQLGKEHWCLVIVNILEEKLTIEKGEEFFSLFGIIEKELQYQFFIQTVLQKQTVMAFYDLVMAPFDDYQRIIAEMLERKQTNGALKTMIRQESGILNIFDDLLRDMKSSSPSQLLWRILMAILLVESLSKKNLNEIIIQKEEKFKIKEFKTIFQLAAFRILDYLQSSDGKVVFLLVTWVKIGNFWKSEELKSGIIERLMVLHEINLWKNKKKSHICRKLLIEEIEHILHEERFSILEGQFGGFQNLEEIVKFQKRGRSSREKKSRSKSKKKKVIQLSETETRSLDNETDHKKPVKKLKKSVLQHLKNVELEKVYIEIKNNLNLMMKSQFSKELKQIFYLVLKHLGKKNQKIQNNTFITAIFREVSKLPLFFNQEEIKMKENELKCSIEGGNFDNLLNHLCQNRTGLNLDTVYRLKTAYLNPSEKCKLKLFQTKTNFERQLNNLATMLMKNEENLQYNCMLNEIMESREFQLKKILFLNVVYSLLLYEESKQFNTKKSIKQLIKFYLYEQGEESSENDEIKNLLMTAHKHFAEWEKSDLIKFKQNKPSNIYFMCFDKVQYLKKFSQQFEKINLIKESIYFNYRYYLRHFPRKFEEADCFETYYLFERLDENMKKLLPYVEKKFCIPQQNSDPSKTKIKKRKVVKKENLKAESKTWIMCLNILLKEKEVDSLEFNIKLVQVLKNFANTIQNLKEKQEIDLVLKSSKIVSFFIEYLKNCDNLMELVNLLTEHQDKEQSLKLFELLYELPIRNDENKRKMYYWKSMFEVEEYEKLLSVIEFDRKRSPSEMNLQELKFCLLINFKKKNYEQVANLYKHMQNYLNEHKYSRNHMPRQVIYPYLKSMFTQYVHCKFNVVYETVMTFLKNINVQDEGEIEAYHEIFKFMMENGRFQRKKEKTQMFSILQNYCAIVEKYEKYDASVDAFHFALRFLFQKCPYIKEQEKEFLKKIRPIPSIIMAQRQYLINSIGDNQDHNLLIVSLLEDVAEKYPKQSTWWIYSLASHCQIPQWVPDANVMRKNQNHIDFLIEKIGKELKRKRQAEHEYFEFIGAMERLPCNAQIPERLRRIPRNLVSPFDNNIVLEEFLSFKKIGEGKSDPGKFEFKARNRTTGESLKLFIIRKPIDKKKGDNYRIQSQTANFFKDCGIIDPDVTYSIEHLSKHVVLAEFVENKGNLLDLMTKNMPSKQKKYLFDKSHDLHIKKRTNQQAFQLLNETVRFRFYEHMLENACLEEWWEKYKNFVTSLAQWSFVGYTVDLGDRHPQNILINYECKVIHVDFEYVFSEGKFLPVPEWVPFRLTVGMINQLAIIEPYGLFLSEFVKASQKFKANKLKFQKALNHFGNCEEIQRRIVERAELENRMQEKSIEIIEKATSKKLLKDMYIGWKSFY